tara:strand:- start:4 stop:804 length:801 start_codon:yes stop_codon:yes gene_type:complete
MSIKIAVLNLMPNKVETERHLKNKICSLDKNLEFTFIKTATYVSKNTDPKYLNNYYKELDDIKDKDFDAFICTGAPLEKIPFESVIYWRELTKIFDWAREKIFSSYFICWGAQAALYHHYGIDKYLMKEKISGVFFQKKHTQTDPLTEKLPKNIPVPISRYASINESDLLKFKELELILGSKDSGPCLVVNKKDNEYYNFNHFEYDCDTLKNEYLRDLKVDSKTQIPTNYFPNNDPENDPIDCWMDNSKLFFNNWIDLISINKREK